MSRLLLVKSTCTDPEQTRMSVIDQELASCGTADGCAYQQCMAYATTAVHACSSATPSKGTLLLTCPPGLMAHQQRCHVCLLFQCLVKLYDYLTVVVASHVALESVVDAVRWITAGGAVCNAFN